MLGVRECRERKRREDKRSIVLCGSRWLLFSSVATTTARERTDKLTRWLETQGEEAERPLCVCSNRADPGVFQAFPESPVTTDHSDGSRLSVNFSSLFRQGKSTCEDQRTSFVSCSLTRCSTFRAYYLGFSHIFSFPPTLFAYFPSSFPSHTILKGFKGWQKITVKNFTVTLLNPGSKHISVLLLIYSAFTKAVYRFKALRRFV